MPSIDCDYFVSFLYTSLCLFFLVYNMVAYILGLNDIQKRIGHFLVIPKVWRIFVITPKNTTVKVLGVISIFLFVRKHLVICISHYVSYWPSLVLGQVCDYRITHWSTNLIYPYAKKHILNLLFCCFSLRLYFTIRDFGSTDVGCLVIYQWRRYLWPGEDYQYPLNTSDVFR